MYFQNIAIRSAETYYNILCKEGKWKDNKRRKV